MINQRKLYEHTLLWGVMTLLVGCSGGYAPVTEQSISQNRRVEIIRSNDKNQTYYRVKSGDTLYSIAWRYGLDYRVLAQMNGIGSDYRIYSGQTLNLKSAASIEPAPTANREITQVDPFVSEGDAKPIISRSVKPTADLQTKEAAPVAEPESPKPVRTVQVAAVDSKNIVWKWPVDGRLIKSFSAKSDLNKGIDLDGKMGDPVYAAASGKVVYAGSGLLGYGNLIIINHNQEYLSAYAHNSRILATENDNVNVGQKIAEIGNSGAARTMLHFEIRKDGKPVNPLRYLPNR